MEQKSWKDWLVIGTAIVALVIAIFAAIKDGAVSSDEAAEIKEKAGAVVDAFAGGTQNGSMGAAE